MSAEKQVRPSSVPAEVYGLADAVRVGGFVFVSGQTAFVGGDVAEPIGDMATQMRVAYGKVGAVLETFGASMADVVDETLFVTDLAGAVDAARMVRHDVYGGRFELASTLVKVEALGLPTMDIEIKCIAVAPA